MSVAVLVSQYPAPSHTFIRREVMALRKRGLQVDTFSVRRPRDEELRDPIDRASCSETWYVLPCGIGALAGAHLRQLTRHPGRWFATLALALRHRLAGRRGLLWSIVHFTEAVRLADELERRSCRHIHCHFSNAAATVALLAARLGGIGWSLTLHGSADFDAPTRALLAAKIENALFTFCVSHHGLAQAMYLTKPEFWDRLSVARCGVEISDQRATISEAPQDSRLLVLCIGRLEPEKGHLGLIEAFASLIARGVDAKLRLVGEGPERARLERRISSLGLSSRCALPGLASEAEVRKELEGATVFALPSLLEGLPVVLMEAMAAGVPVVAPRIAGIPELVEHGRSGLLFTPARWDELSACVERLLLDASERARLALEARRAVALEFEIDVAVQPLERRFRAVLDGR